MIDKKFLNIVMLFKFAIFSVVLIIGISLKLYFPNGLLYYLIFMLLVFAIIECIRIHLFRKFRKANKLANDAYAYLIDDDFDNCLKICDEILSLESDNFFGLYYKSYALFEKGNYSEALKLLDNILEFERKFNVVLFEARIHIALKDYEKGWECYKNSFDRDDFDNEEYVGEIFKLSLLYFVENDLKIFEIMRDCCDLYLERIAGSLDSDKENESQIRFFRGLALSNLGSNEESLKEFDLSIELGPENILAYNQKVRLLISLEKYDEALEVADQGLRIFPHSQLNLYKSTVLNSMDRPDEALIYVERFLNHNDEDNEFYDEALEFKEEICDELKYTLP